MMKAILLSVCFPGSVCAAAAQNAVMSALSSASSVALPIIACVVLAISAAMLMLNRKAPKTTKPETSSPDGLPPVELEYRLSGEPRKADVTSMIYFWASHGHLTIELTGEESFTLHKRSELERTHRIYERELFAELWKLAADGETVTSDDLFSSSTALINKANVDLGDIYKGSLAVVDNDRAGVISYTVSFIALIVAELAVFFGVAAHGAASIADFTAVMAANSTVMLFRIAETICAFLLLHLFRKTLVAESKDGTFKHSLGLFLIVMLFFFYGQTYISSGLTIFERSTVAFSDATRMVSVFAMALAALLIFFQHLRPQLPRRTLAFKDYLRRLDGGQLKALNASDPAFFYKMLPYALALNMSAEWLARGEELKLSLPEWFICGNDTRGLSRIEWNISRMTILFHKHR